jgi:hypothetical protein
VRLLLLVVAASLSVASPAQAADARNGGIDALPIRFEPGVSLLEPGEAPPDGTPAPLPTATPPSTANPSGASWVVILVVAVAGLGIGVGAALRLGRKRGR